MWMNRMNWKKQDHHFFISLQEWRASLQTAPPPYKGSPERHWQTQTYMWRGESQPCSIWWQVKPHTLPLGKCCIVNNSGHRGVVVQRGVVVRVLPHTWTPWWTVASHIIFRESNKNIYIKWVKICSFLPHSQYFSCILYLRDLSHSLITQVFLHSLTILCCIM